MYMIILRLSTGSEPGIDVPKIINQINSLLGDYAKATKCLYKFKVSCLFGLKLASDFCFYPEKKSI